MKLESIALHHGYTAEPTTHAAAVPIYQTTSYTFDDTQHGADRGRRAALQKTACPIRRRRNGRVQAMKPAARRWSSSGSSLRSASVCPVTTSNGAHAPITWLSRSTASGEE